MFTKIELENFQSHKNTVIELNKNINAFCGESDNGKSAIIRGIRWLVENRPLGTDKLNSNWNKDFKNSMRVRLYTENGWVERIRTKDRNGYTICKDNSTPIELSAVGTDVPADVIEFLRVSDVNFQYQLDQPYLLSMSAGEASKYLNNIIHLDSIDKMLAAADSNKRAISSEQKVVDSDIKTLETSLENSKWIDEALAIKTRMEKYDTIIESKKNDINEINREIEEYKSIRIYDMSEQKKLINDIESIDIPDCSELKNEIEEYKSAKEKYVDLSDTQKLIKEIEEINVPDVSELKNEVEEYKSLSDKILILSKEINGLKEMLPQVCPLCGGKITEGANLCF